MSTKLQLLKLTKQELIKKCKSHHIKTNGTKNDMVNRLLSSKHTARKKKSNLSKRHVQMPNERSCFYLFVPDTLHQFDNTLFYDTFVIDAILNILIGYLPIYTLSNFICCFPDYNYSNSKLIRTAIRTANKLNYNNINNHCFEYEECIKSKLSFSDKYQQNIYQYTIKENLWDAAITKYASIKTKPYVFGKRYSHCTGSDQGYNTKYAVQLNKTDIYHIHQLLTLYVGLKENEYSMDRCPRYSTKRNVNKMKQILDAIGLDDIGLDSFVNDCSIYTNIVQNESKLFLYLFLEFILSFNGGKRILYSSMYQYERNDPGSYEDLVYGYFDRSFTFIFAEKSIPCRQSNKIYFRISEE